MCVHVCMCGVCVVCVCMMVKHFSHLGSIMSRDGDVTEDVKCRIVKISRVYGCLRGLIFNNPILPFPIKRAVYKAIVLWYCYMGIEIRRPGVRVFADIGAEGEVC